MKALDIEPFGDGPLHLWDRIGRLTYIAVEAETLGLLTWVGTPGRLVCLCREGRAVYLLRAADVIGRTEEPCPHERAYLEHEDEARRHQDRPNHAVNVAAMVD